MCEPGLPPQDALWDVFGRFGNLIEMYVLNGKNCGYAKYADKDSALQAVEVTPAVLLWYPYLFLRLNQYVVIHFKQQCVLFK